MAFYIGCINWTTSSCLPTGRQLASVKRFSGTSLVPSKFIDSGYSERPRKFSKNKRPVFLKTGLIIICTL